MLCVIGWKNCLTPETRLWLDRCMEATTATTQFLHLLWEHLCSFTTDPQARLALVRTAKARPITGGPIHGWKF